ncbi:LeuA family protein [Halorarum salinum]|uniref:Citramalate synthase n=1 Tax=Halorarum salinum TaxID=2743089 RepID=A0A7D5LDC9_9EURY|nr:citramalate synthase [Halobaculum salinum]QLG63914.1 citramalate synthase [Halobaculum salinum]
MLLSDVTLREGDQRPGTSYTATQKIEAGRRLDDLGLAFVQPGFPATGEKDRRVIGTLAGECSADVVGLSRAKPSDVEATAAADADVVDVIVPASDAHREHMIGKPREDVHGMVEEAIDLARDHGLAVHLTLTDAFRADAGTLIDAYERYPDVPRVTLADTVGAKTPPSVTRTLEAVTDAVDPSRVGVHFHDDLGVATANTLAAVAVGVGKVDASVASIGERAGNAALEEVVVADATDQGIGFDVDLRELVPACRAVLDVLDETVPEDKPVLGSGVFEHESGLHTAAMLSDPAAFEPFDPARFGGERRLLFGEQTGVGAAGVLLDRAGVTPSEDRCRRLLDVLAEHGPVDADGATDLIDDHVRGE